MSNYRASSVKVLCEIKDVTEETAKLIRAVQAYFNEKVADHRNRHLGEEGALRLVNALPELQAIVAAHKEDK